MIISLDGYGKILHEKSVAKKLFKKVFSHNRYYFDDELGNKGFNSLSDNSLLPETQECELKDTVTGTYRKINHEDIPFLIRSDKDKKTLLFTEIAGGFHSTENSELLYGEFNSIVWDVFLYLKGLLSSECQIILVKPNDLKEEIHLSENTYWGVSSFDGNFLFSSSIKDNLPSNYGNNVNGYGIKFIVRLPDGNELEVAKVDAVFDLTTLKGINFEINMDAITAVKLGKNKTLYGSLGYVDDIKYYSLGDMYKEKMLDAIMGLIGTYTTKEELDYSDINFNKIYLEVIASICILRDISEDELKIIIMDLMEGLNIKSSELVNFLIELILHEEEVFISSASKKQYKSLLSGVTLKNLAIDKIQRQINLKERQRTIKKPQE